MQESIDEIIEGINEADAVKKNASVAIYETHDQAEAAVRKLEHEGFDMTKLSIIGKDFQTEEGVLGFYTSGDRMKAWGKGGAFWGGILGLLSGSALFVIPGIGPLLVAGPIVAWIVGVLEGAVVVGGLSALGAGLYSIGIPEDAIIEYETQIKAGKFAVIANGTLTEVSEIEAALAA
jgi:hypothetical protein